MIVLNFIWDNQIMLGLLVALLFFVSWKKRRSYFWFRIIPLYVGAVCLSHFADISMPYSLLVYFAVTFFIVLICFDCNLKHALFAATGAYCIQHITSKATYVLWYLYIYNFGINLSIWTQGILLVLLVVNLIALAATYFFFTRHLFKNSNLKFDSAKILIASASFIVAAVFLSYYIEGNLEREFYLKAYCCLNIFCILFAILVLFMNAMNCKNKQIEEEKEMIERLLQKDELQYERAKLNMERIDIRYHDLKHQPGIVMDEKEKEKLDEEIKELQAMYYTGNKALDITLSEKALACAGAGIQFVCSVDGSCLDMLTSYHLYSLLGNAIDNAMECLMQVEEEAKRVLRISIGYRGEMSIIHVQNYTPNQPLFEDGVPQTTKRDRENHGFGIKSIKNIVEEYKGETYISVKDNVFNLTIMLPKIDKK